MLLLSVGSRRLARGLCSTSGARSRVLELATQHSVPKEADLDSDLAVKFEVRAVVSAHALSALAAPRTSSLTLVPPVPFPCSC